MSASHKAGTMREIHNGDESIDKTWCNNSVQLGRARVGFAIRGDVYTYCNMYNVNDVRRARMVYGNDVYGESGAIDRGKRRYSFGRRTFHFHGQLASPTRNATLAPRGI